MYQLLSHAATYPVKLKAGQYVLKMTQINKNLLEKIFLMDCL
jgi:hypothetical protein